MKSGLNEIDRRLKQKSNPMVLTKVAKYYPATKKYPWPHYGYVWEMRPRPATDAIHPFERRIARALAMAS
jgi:hypothetical protein